MSPSCFSSLHDKRTREAGQIHHLRGHDCVDGGRARCTKWSCLGLKSRLQYAIVVGACAGSPHHQRIFVSGAELSANPVARAPQTSEPGIANRRLYVRGAGTISIRVVARPNLAGGPVGAEPLRAR